MRNRRHKIPPHKASQCRHGRGSWRTMRRRKKCDDRQKEGNICTSPKGVKDKVGSGPDVRSMGQEGGEWGWAMELAPGHQGPRWLHLKTQIWSCGQWGTAEGWTDLHFGKTALQVTWGMGQWRQSWSLGDHPGGHHSYLGTNNGALSHSSGRWDRVRWAS